MHVPGPIIRLWALVWETVELLRVHKPRAVERLVDWTRWIFRTQERRFDPMRRRRRAYHLAQLTPASGGPGGSMPAAQPAALAHVAQQAFANFQVGKQLAHRIVQVDRVPFLDLRPAQIFQVVR